MRVLVAVFALGTILLFVLMSTLDAFSALRSESSETESGHAMKARWPLPAQR